MIEGSGFTEVNLMRRCQPIKYVLSGFVRRTGSFGPIGRSTEGHVTIGVSRVGNVSKDLRYGVRWHLLNAELHADTLKRSYA